MAVLGCQLDLMILEVFYNLSDYLILFYRITESVIGNRCKEDICSKSLLRSGLPSKFDQIPQQSLEYLQGQRLLEGPLSFV